MTETNDRDGIQNQYATQNRYRAKNLTSITLQKHVLEKLKIVANSLKINTHSQTVDYLINSFMKKGYRQQADE